VRPFALLFLLLFAPLPAQDGTPAASSEVVFLHWNDLHGQFRPQLATWKARAGGDQRELPRVGGAAVLAGYVREARAAAARSGARVIATDAGDWYQGTLEGNDTKGRLVVEFLSRLKPDCAVLGNHEYDFGPDNVRALVAAAKFPVLGANIVVAGKEPRTLCDYVRPFHVVDVHGLKIAIVGLITAKTRDVSTGPWGEAAFEDEAAALRVVLPQAQKAADVVVLLTHCGVDVDRKLAQAFPQVPLILGGHSHTGLKEPVREGTTWIVQTHGTASNSTCRAMPRTRRQHRGLLLPPWTSRRSGIA
jgi:5'-nucleotidase / UDP-sugar diphosphatase